MIYKWVHWFYVDPLEGGGVEEEEEEEELIEKGASTNVKLTVATRQHITSIAEVLHLFGRMSRTHYPRNVAVIFLLLLSIAMVGVCYTLIIVGVGVCYTLMVVVRVYYTLMVVVVGVYYTLMVLVVGVCYTLMVVRG